MTELKVSGHLMTLDPGLFCVVQTANAPGSASGLPGVRLSLPPGAAGRGEGVRISTFREDGWLGERDGAALVRVVDGPAQVLVTIYQAPDATPEQAPRLQVLRLSGEAPASGTAAQGAGSRPTPANADVVAHVQRMGDLGAAFGEWMGTRGSRLWIEGFGIAPREGVAPSDIEYQAVLGRDWLSPWVEGGKFCGSRGMALPLLGLTVRLKGQAAGTHELSYEATFVDGSASGPVQAGEPCQAESLAALEAFRIDLRPKGAVTTPARTPASRRGAETRVERAAAPAAPGRKSANRG
ncbi:MAG: hypothetical protein JOY66_17215 [Acetobacteraceae bacterium]|nr:hypothetical protein [Acetobacteraceae bacterium]